MRIMPLSSMASSGSTSFSLKTRLLVKLSMVNRFRCVVGMRRLPLPAGLTLAGRQGESDCTVQGL